MMSISSSSNNQPDDVYKDVLPIESEMKMTVFNLN